MFELKKLDPRRPGSANEYLILKELESFLNSPFCPDDSIWQEQMDSILAFQSGNGDFFLTDPVGIPGDAFNGYCAYPTVLSSAILMKALLCSRGEEKKYLPPLKKALDAVVRVGIGGHGYDDMDVEMQNIRMYFDAGLPFFLDRYPELSRPFSTLIESVSRMYGMYIERGDFIHGFGQNYEKKIREINALFSLHRIFVYGTLMRGKANHHYLEGERFEGEGYIEYFNLYDLGHFPGIRPSVHSSRRVEGELYSVSSACLEKVNRLEDEGRLYRLECTCVQVNGNSCTAGVYVYNRKANRETRIESGSWK